MVRQLGTLRKGEFGFSSLSEVKFLVEKGWVNIVVAFSLVVDRELLNDTHRWRQIHVRSRQWTCFSCFHAPNPSINHLNFYCMKQIDYIFPCVCTVI